MPSPNYRPAESAQELLDRYEAGERHFPASKLRNADLRGARLSGANLSQADLTGADLSGAIIEDAIFWQADLTRANLRNAKCQDGDFTGAILSQATLPGNRYDNKIVAQASKTYRGRDECVFASYARIDETLVSSLVALIRSLGSRVFMDVNSIVPGEKWRPALTSALADASIVVVFWCEHSACSEEVKKEYQSAHAQGKRIIPVLLDNTPTSRPLADYQWLDFRGTFASHDASNTRKRFADVELARKYPRPQPGPEVLACLEEAPIIEKYERDDIEAAQRSLVEAIVAAVESGSNGALG